MHGSFSWLLILPAAGLLAAAIPCQRGVTTITTSTEVHTDAQISPDGSMVAWRGPSKIGAVGISGGAETVLASGTQLGSFLWEPSSTGIYFIDGVSLQFVGRNGGAPRHIANLPGANHVLWCADAMNQKVWGSRYDTTARQYDVFVIDSAGMTFKDILTSLGVIDGVRLDPTETKILFQVYSPQPFQPHEYFKADPDGQNVVSLTMGPLAGLSDNADWVDAAMGFALSVQSPLTMTLQVARIDPGPTLTLLTGSPSQRRHTTISADRQWIACEELTAGGAVPVVLPPQGGGVIMLDNVRRFVFTSLPTMDRSGTKLAFSASLPGPQNPSQIQAVDLVRELRIHPRVEVAKTFTVELPVAAAEQGVAFLAVGLLTQILTIPGLQHGLTIDPSLLVQLLSGVGNGSGPLSVNVPVPNDPSLVGAQLYVQGVRVKSLAPLDGDFTRHATLRIF